MTWMFVRYLVLSTGKVLRGFRRLELTKAALAADTDNGVGG
jgi:hypothetical protein